MKQLHHGQPAFQRLASLVDSRPSLRRFGTALLLTALGLATGSVQAQQRLAPSFFQADVAARTAAAVSPLAVALTHSQALTLDVAGLRAALASAPLESRAGAAPLVVALPLPNGTTGRFAVREAPVMEPALAARYPMIKTYAGVGLDDATASVRVDLSPVGFHAQVLAGDGQSFYIDPVNRTDGQHYLAFYRKDMNRAAAGKAMSCEFASSSAEVKASAARVMARTSGSRATLASGTQLRTFRLALSCTPEYAVTKGNTTMGVMAGEVATVNRVVGVFEKELAIRLVLVANNDQLIFLSGTGPQPMPAFSNSSSDLLIDQNQQNVDRVIGTANYDIGHVVSTGGGGLASLGVVCDAAQKAQGVTGSDNPVGDAFDIDFVAHEMGHQFSGNHPFNGDADACAGTNRNLSTAWEPGSGTTIMAYAGICGSANDLQPNSDATFHTGSYEEMRAFINGTPCGVNTPTGNTAPVVTAPASGKTLPISTPFKLTATATDGENDPLTYSWEELDLGPTGSPTATQVAGQNVPLFRSFNPTVSGTRYFPRLSNLVANTTRLGERLPTVNRVLTFRCTARDEHRGPAGIIGGVDFSSLVTLNVSSASGPFVVQAPNTAVSWIGGSAQTVSWDVAGTTNAPVSCARVNIRLSLDGGLSYPTVLASNVPNNGSAIVVAPRPATTQTAARIMVEAADNYFFDISNVDFTITTPAVGPTISSFSPTGGLAGTVVTVLGSNFTGATAVAFNGTAATSFTVVSATQLTATVAAGTTTGVITVTAPTGVGTSATPFVVGVPPVVTSFTPITGAVGTVVVITGTNFTLASQVRFNTTSAPVFTLNSATQITATVPPNATTGLITVTTPVGSGSSTANFTVIPAPVITSFSPAGGSIGTVVTLTGNYFTGATQVTFNGTVAPVFTVVSATQITVTVPTGATTGLIAVTGAGGVGSSTTAFVIPPANDLCANALPLTCGQSVTGSTVGATSVGDPTGNCTVDLGEAGVFYTIVGTGGSIRVSTCNVATTFDTMLFVYTGACGVYTCVGGNDDAACSGGNSAASAVTFPSVAGVVYRVLVCGFRGGTGPFVLSAVCATPPPAPVVSSLSPVTGPAGTAVTLTGSNLIGATTLTLNGLAVTGFTVVSATSITFTVPVGGTTGSVVVTTAGGVSNATQRFTVTTPSATANATATSFSVWPNPITVKGTLQITLTAPVVSASLVLRNVLGQVMSTRTFSGSTTELATAGLAAGTYLLTVQTAGRTPTVQRVVVE